MPDVRAFNVAYDGRAAVLFSQVRIQATFDPKVLIPPVPTKVYKAIWDTGATRSAITSTVASECGLKPTGMSKVSTASGETITSTYYISLYLPNGVCLSKVLVTEAMLSGADVLIGMDVIASGDFAVTNHHGKTNMSFRMPSVEYIDFVKQINIDKAAPGQPVKAAPKIGRNKPCPCDSGKKYKHCCAR